MPHYEVNLSAEAKDIDPILNGMVELFNRIKADPVHAFIAVETMRNHLANELVRQGIVKPTPMPDGLRVVKDGEV